MEGETESRLRRVCNRCHHLKSRCQRLGGNDTRCERCERLDLDCVYQRAARMGRPRIHTQSPSATSTSSPQPSRSRRASKSSHTGSCSTPSSVYDNNDGLITYGNNSGAQPGDIPKAIPEHGHLSDSTCESTAVFDLEHLQGAHSDHGDWIEGATDEMAQAYYVPNFQGLSSGLPEQQQTAMSLGVDMSYQEPGFPRTKTMANQMPASLSDKLLQLQSYLHSLLSSTMHHDSSENRLDGALGASKALLEILQEHQEPHLGSSSHVGDFQQRSFGVSQESASCGSFCHITALHAITCYSYTLRLFEPIVALLVTKSGGPLPVINLGLFNLASQPALNTSVIAHLMLQMIQELRRQVHTLISAHCGGRDNAEVAAVALPDPSDHRRHPHAAPSSDSSCAVIDFLGATEKAIIEGLSKLTS
ncbi:C6 finger domain-containing protein [Apiospora kogelbergensis]|uniref:C6 finger domain-containing protein n=1 Tax=Apiospora kogelbergensis TaxID=1337665 RepID=UPI00312EEC46